NDTMASTVGQVLHKHGAPPALGQELYDLYVKQITGDQETVVNAMKKELTDLGVKLKDQYKDKYGERLESAKRLAKQYLANPEILEHDPDLLPIFMALGPLAESDSSFVRDKTRAGGELQGEAAQREYIDIIKNPDNPKHKLYWGLDDKGNRTKQPDTETVNYVQELAKRAHPGERNLR
ncbi:MAG: hypothetical protein MN733_08820, partial [Nitrososphaera sp.]|nr:hypothetical protein [Nitrososphaera sp.]